MNQPDPSAVLRAPAVSRRWRATHYAATPQTRLTDPGVKNRELDPRYWPDLEGDVTVGPWRSSS